MAPATKLPGAASNGLKNLFLDQLKDTYYAERKIVKTLPKMAKAAQSSDLKAAFEKHLIETEGQIERLEQVFQLLGIPAKGKTCPAIDGILDEGAEILDEYKGDPALDAGLIAAAQAVEHYEIARYGTMLAWAEKLGISKAVSLLKQTLDQEEATDIGLTELADSGVNDHAMKQEAA